LGTPNFPSSKKALYQNQQDLGKNLAQFCGAVAGKNYAALLTIHIDIAIKIVTDILTSVDPTNDIKAWYANAEQIAAFLDRTIFCIEFQKIKKLLFLHLDCTLDEAGLIINKDYAGSLVEYQLCLRRVKEMSDYIAFSIFSSCCDGNNC